MIKKLISQDVKDKKKKREQIIWGLILAFLILFSSLGYAFLSRGDSVEVENFEYAGLEFVQNNGFWITQIGNKVVYFANLPTELADVSINGSYSFEDYSGRVVYFVNSQPGAELVSYALQSVALRMQDACVEGFTCANDELPIKTCDDNVIIFSPEFNETKLYKNNNCIIIEGDSSRGVDKLIYRLYNII